MSQFSSEPTDDDNVPEELRSTPSVSHKHFAKFVVLILIVIAAGIALRPVVPWVAALGRSSDDAEEFFDDNWREAKITNCPDWFLSVALAESDRLLGRVERSPQGSIKLIYLPNGMAVSDSWMSNLESLTSLEVLELSHTSVTDKGLISLRQLPKLEELRLDASKVTGSGFQTSPSGFSSLKILSLKSCPVSDVSLRSIATIRSLEGLNLSGTQITDAELVNLSQLPELQELDLTGTKVTATGVQSLQRSLPNCRILR